LISLVVLAGGCHHPRPKGAGDTMAISDGSQLSQTLVGKRITIRGGLFRFKCGPGIQFDDGHVVCLADIPPKSGLDDPYAEMYEKLVEATGTLRFYHDSTQGERDHYYFEKETLKCGSLLNILVTMQHPLLNRSSHRLLESGSQFVESFNFSVSRPAREFYSTMRR